MFGAMREALQQELSGIRDAGLFKHERTIRTPQAANIRVAYPEDADPQDVLNFCANNYLGLSSHPAVIEAATNALQTHGYGMSSVRFICGTQDIHRQLERTIASFLGTDDAILYAACFDANGGVFEPLLNARDAIITDQLNHASIIDGVRLCKAKRYIFKHANMADLEQQLTQAQSARYRIIVTDGAFSMDGDIAKLDKICELAERFDALVMSDECHCTGFLGKTGRGAIEHCGVQGRVDIITGTLGKALGGASGGFTAGRQEIIDLLRQRSRPYLFSNTVAPPIVAASLKVLEILTKSTELRDKLESNTKRFREKMTAAGFDIRPGEHPIVPIMLYNAPLAQKIASDLYEKGIYVIGFFFPVVPKGEARIRVQLSAAHEFEHIDRAVQAFCEVGEQHGILHKSKDQIIAEHGE
ncbi:MAG: glycine C-acetyltransferase [Planctomycetes bacterium]|nr:glycine C-acetyltransferase [Planctomycetota bacterium]